MQGKIFVQEEVDDRGAKRIINRVIYKYHASLLRNTQFNIHGVVDEEFFDSHKDIIQPLMMTLARNKDLIYCSSCVSVKFREDFKDDQLKQFAQNGKTVICKACQTGQVRARIDTRAKPPFVYRYNPNREEEVRAYRKHFYGELTAEALTEKEETIQEGDQEDQMSDIQEEVKTVEEQNTQEVLEHVEAIEEREEQETIHHPQQIRSLVKEESKPSLSSQIESMIIAEAKKIQRKYCLEVVILKDQKRDEEMSAVLETISPNWARLETECHILFAAWLIDLTTEDMKKIHPLANSVGLSILGEEV